jgi:hypothetical protein
MKVVVIGGGWAGCAAALSAAKQGAEVTLAERTDMLLGTGLVGGIFRNNGRFTATEEAIALGGGELFELMDAHAVHKNIEFPGHKHASLYNIMTIEQGVARLLKGFGVQLRMSTRVTDVAMDGQRMAAVMTAKDAGEERFEADAFVETTGTSGNPYACGKYGNGCGMCVLRCHAFGVRVSIAGRAGIAEITGKKGDQFGAMSGSCELIRESLADDVLAEMSRTGMVMRPIPEFEDDGSGKLDIKACQQYTQAEYKTNVVVLDTGGAKLMTPYFPLPLLRRVRGFENARYSDPYGGTFGNSIRYINMAPRNDALKIDGLENVFCAGEKAGLLVGHTEAVVTGTLAGYNAARHADGKQPLILPDTLLAGDAVSHVREQMQTEKGLGMKFTFSGSVFFERMKQRGSYLTDVAEIRRRVAVTGLANVFAACPDVAAMHRKTVAVSAD